jgi:hypothetical protein
METTLLLREDAKSTEIQNSATRAGSKHDEVAGCNCDRWGHPCKDCTNEKTRPKIILMAVPVSD